ncbi:alpha/beta fold hydrolase [Sorangium sp. So ce1504]|uniref:alpha/beta fold hydrolase n=2 Tax=unclassified Sorangium TaxID=2621164 RepID=UPI003F61E230
MVSFKFGGGRPPRLRSPSGSGPEAPPALSTGNRPQAPPAASSGDGRQAPPPPSSGGRRGPPSRRPSLRMETRRVTSFDGTDITYRVTPPPFEGAKTVVLVNGLGGPYLAWRAQVEYLSDQYRFITWDYRGMYASKRPSPDVPGAYAVANHVRDLEAILAVEGIRHGALMGWSVGVQVALEAFRRLPGFAANLVLLNGTYRRPLETMGPLPGLGRLFPPFVAFAARAHTLAARVTRSTFGPPDAVLWLKRMGLLGKTLDSEAFAELVQPFGQLDMDALCRNLRALDAHDAEHVLEQIDVPTLLITGDRDAFTPRALAQSMARRIPMAEILVVRGGTHTTAVEFPELVSLRIERFFADHGF